METNEKAVLRRIGEILFQKDPDQFKILSKAHKGNGYTLKDLLKTMNEADEDLKKGQD